MTKNSSVFASSIVQAFNQKIIQDKITGGEIKLFHALMHAFNSPLNNLAIIEEYHGANHQVVFSGNGTYTRSNARCELSDLMIVAFNSYTVRLTYLQAKYEKTNVKNVKNHQWAANLEQWFLLHNLPTIQGCSNFNPPNDLLSSAILRSIGSFGFFSKNGTSFDMYYVSAENLELSKIYTRKNGKLIFKNTIFNQNSTYTECREAINLTEFCQKLYQLEIGTPLSPSIQSWLISILSNLKGSLAKDLFNLLNEDKSSEFYPPQISFGAKKLLLIKIND